MTILIKIYKNADLVAQHSATRIGEFKGGDKFHDYKLSNGAMVGHLYHEGVNQLCLKVMQNIAADDLLRRNPKEMKQPQEATEEKNQ